MTVLPFAMFWTITGLLVIFDKLNAQTAGGNKFSCEGRPAGYYADVDSGCQIYHMCDGLGRQFSYSCPNTTLFQQRMLICDHWYMVNCSRSEGDYSANLLIGQNRPFVEDSEKHPYHRTPRPDLLSQPTASEYNIVYRRGTSQYQNDPNVVGIDSDYDQNNGSSAVTDKPAYNLPTHWSTEYTKDGATEAPRRVQQDDVQASNADAHTTVEVFDKSKERAQSGRAIKFDSNSLANNLVPSKTIGSFVKKERPFPVNFRSFFKNTTPVFPTKEELGTTSSSVDEDLLPPEQPERITPQPVENSPHVNFKSVFKATTPVFPTKEELSTTPSSIDDILQAPVGSDSTGTASENRNLPPVNFKSLFKNTTPVFPTEDELTTYSTFDDLKPPKSVEAVREEENSPSVNFKSSFRATTPVYPTKEELGDIPSSGEEALAPPKVGGHSLDGASSPPVNFKSSFRATTPVYPTKEELGEIPSSGEEALAPPKVGGHSLGNISSEILPPAADSSNSVRDSSVDIADFAPPSKFYRPPFFAPDYQNMYRILLEKKSTASSESSGDSYVKNADAKSKANGEVLADIKEMFSIPDYDFPLDTVTRPSYGIGPDSFQVNPFAGDIEPREHADS